jgi:hypothetical protein
MMTSIAANKPCPRYAAITIVAILAIGMDAHAVSAAPTTASQVEVGPNLNRSRSQLEVLYPDLPARELDKLLFRIADANSMKRVATAGPAGDWFCATEASPVRLTMRATSYFLVRGSGPSMAGEYHRAGDSFTISSGPLRGMGAVNGTVIAEQGGRVLRVGFDDAATMTCREVL